LPVEHTSPALHALPHAPQFAGSRATTVQLAPHTCAPSPQFRPPSAAGATVAGSLEHATKATRALLGSL
jgi:hypothetical protein